MKFAPNDKRESGIAYLRILLRRLNDNHLEPTEVIDEPVAKKPRESERVSTFHDFANSDTEDTGENDELDTYLSSQLLI